jgi:hypothetical protein
MSHAILSARVLAVPALLIGAALATATPAHAWWRGGVFIGVPPVVIGAPAYYPPAYYPYYPPAYYYPPAPPPNATPVPQPQAQHGPVAYGTTCYAGVYVCPAPTQTQVGGGCTCPGLGAPSYGVVN